nr:gastrula zinc finger protein XlCGF42.1-like [Onthophagus taurus]
MIYCVPTTLESYEDWFICQNCLLLLRSSHKFINMVISSQEYLKICNEHTNEEVCSDLDQEIDVITPDLVNCNKKTPKVDKNNFFCKICNIKFKNQKLLSNHLKETHNHNKTHNKIINNTNKHYQCHYCKKIFKQSWHLHDHITSHLGDKKYKCILCDKTFLRVTSLRRHFKIHERAPGEKVKHSPVLCTICGKKILYSNGLQRHMRMHLGIKQHECEFCKRKFAQKTHLLAHRRTHTGEKPYICDTCGEAFTLNASLRKHINTHKKNVNLECTCY